MAETGRDVALAADTDAAVNAWANGLAPIADPAVVIAAAPVIGENETPASPVSSVSRLSSEEIKRQIDALSLEQALIDFEVANARVLDLTGRLVSTSKRVVDLQTDADALRGQIEELRAQVAAGELRHVELTSSRAYRWGHRLSALRDALRG